MTSSTLASSALTESPVPASTVRRAGHLFSPTVAAKFDNPDFDATLKQKKATTIVIVGTRSNGAVLYTAYEANVRGYTVVVAVDGISGSIPFELTMTEWQLLNQPGFTNADNKPLAEKLVTLSRSDLITFK